MEIKKKFDKNCLELEILKIVNERKMNVKLTKKMLDEMFKTLMLIKNINCIEDAHKTVVVLLKNEIRKKTKRKTI